MRNTLVFCALALFGCGGAEFQLVDRSSPDAGDAGGDVADEPEAGGDADGERDASRDGAALDAGADALDASATCTPIAPSQWATSAPCEGGAIIAPANYEELVTSGGGSCVGRQTPIACRCVETYHCTCLELAAGCPGGRTWQGCHETPGEAPTPICQ